MEVTGLIVGVASLAGLFEACVAAFERVDTYRQFAHASAQLQTQFETQKFLMKDWGARYNLVSPTESSQEAFGPGLLPRRASGFKDAGNPRSVQLPPRLRPSSELPSRLEASLDGERKQRVEETLACIRDLLQDINHYLEKHGLVEQPASGPSQSADAEAKKPSKRSRLEWATGGKSRLVEQVDRFQNMVESLYKLAPPVDSMAETNACPSGKCTSRIVAG